MAAVDLQLFKKHVRADDFADDDDYLSHLLETAEEAVVIATNRTRDELSAMGNGTFPTRSHMLAVPDSLQDLVNPFRKLVEVDSGTDEV